jgi:hypothetical protein
VIRCRGCSSLPNIITSFGLRSVEIPVDAGDFCVMDRAVIDMLKAMPERTRFVRELRSWSGFRQVGVAYERSLRHAGASVLQCVSFGIFSSGHWG